MPEGNAPTFEQALERLEQIVHQLEEGQVGLEESLARYEEGVKLLKRCYAILQQAEKRIELLTDVDEEGNPITEPFDATATASRLVSESASGSNPPVTPLRKGGASSHPENEEDAGKLF